MSEKTESIVPSDYLHDDVQAVAEYRSVSRLAVLAAVLGVCSAVALASSQLLVIPLLGIICALLALWRIAASDGQLAGRTAALVGLALSLAIGTGVYVHNRTLERLIATEAEQWALEWCDLLLDDQVLTALELKSPLESRRPFDDSLAEYYQSNDAAIESLDAFRDNPVVELLTAAPDGAKVVAGDVLGVVPSARGGYTVGQSFELIPASGKTPDSPTEFRLQLTRSPAGSSAGAGWHLGDHVLGE